jgi:cobalt-precorrin-5B (C1)-methyltransferase
VTLPGLPLEVGNAAINPGPRQMIADNLRPLAKQHGTELDLNITVSIPGGEEIALKTMNGRLGIKGGLSILGTTGIVVPFSCASWIHSIHRGIDVARATGITHIAAATGSTSEAAIKAMLNLPETALIDMGDFAGGLLKYLRKHPVAHLTLAGGFGKLSKLAQGHMDLHSSRSHVDMQDLANTAAQAGANTDTAIRIAGANTAMEALQIAKDTDVPLAPAIAGRARSMAMAALAGDTNVDVTIFDRSGKLVARAGA